MKAWRRISHSCSLIIALGLSAGCDEDQPDDTLLPVIDTPEESVVQPETPTQAETTDPTVSLDVNDVTWLFPAPATADDVDRLLTPASLRSDADQSPLFPQEILDKLIAISEGADEFFRVRESNIRFRPAMHTNIAWKVAGFRVDPSAPGATPAIQAVFGQIPQVRLILQPVTVNNGAVRVHDFALHLIYNYITGAEAGPVPGVPKLIPDLEAFQAIADDIVALKALSAENGAPTAGVPLGVHPGLASDTARAAVQAELAAFFSRRLHHQRIMAVAVMGLPRGPEPWIFSAMRRNPTNQMLTVETAPAVGAKAQMLSFLRGTEIIPAGTPSNRIPGRSGVTTGVLFTRGLDLDAEAAGSADPQGNTLTHRQIPDWIAHPHASHFFNTDCISCHTESSRRVNLSIPPTAVAFPVPDGISGLDPSVLPSKDRDGTWNVRNLGWFPPFFGPDKRVRETITMRTFTETVDVLEVMNRDFVK